MKTELNLRTTFVLDETEVQLIVGLLARRVTWLMLERDFDGSNYCIALMNKLDPKVIRDTTDSEK